MNKKNFRKCFCLLFTFLLINLQLYSQLKINDFKKLPLGINFSNYEEIKNYFSASPTLMKGELQDSYQVNYENTQFDKYGSADYVFQFINGILSNLEISFTFTAQHVNEFEYMLKTLHTDLVSTTGMILLKQYSDLKLAETINFVRKECKGIGGQDIEKKFRDNPTKWFGSEVWNIANSQIADNRFMLVTVFLTQTNKQWADKDDNFKSYEYHGGEAGITISLTNNKLQELRNWGNDQASNNYKSFVEQKKKIKLKEVNGVYTLPVTLNNALTLDFVLDLGASDVSISPDVYTVLYRAGKIDEDDYIGNATYTFADGSKAKSNVINLKKLVIGDIVLKNVRASISNSINTPLLLGQSALKQLGKYSIDNTNKQLVIE